MSREYRVRFAFNDWIREGRSIYATEEGIELSSGHFHSGTVFSGSLILSEDSLDDLNAALAAKALPSFEVFEVDEAARFQAIAALRAENARLREALASLVSASEDAYKAGRIPAEPWVAARNVLRASRYEPDDERARRLVR